MLGSSCMPTSVLKSSEKNAAAIATHPANASPAQTRPPLRARLTF